MHLTHNIGRKTDRLPQISCVNKFAVYGCSTTLGPRQDLLSFGHGPYLDLLPLTQCSGAACKACNSCCVTGA